MLDTTKSIQFAINANYLVKNAQQNKIIALNVLMIFKFYKTEIVNVHKIIT